MNFTGLPPYLADLGLTPVGNQIYTIYIPFGSPFVFKSTGSFDSSDTASDFRVVADLQFYELDGVTPVNITDVDTPEPVTLGMLGIGAVALVSIRRKWSRKA